MLYVADHPILSLFILYLPWIQDLRTHRVNQKDKNS